MDSATRTWDRPALPALTIADGLKLPTARAAVRPASPLLVNGRFLQRQVTGVERVAEELLRAMLRCDAAGDAATLRLLLPAGGAAALPEIERRISPGWLPRGHFWEQLVLPAASPGHTLINLTNSAPLARLRQCVFVHDAAVFDIPETYTAAYRWWYRALYRCLQHTPTTICTVSEFSRERLERHLPRLAGRVSVVQPGVDHALRIAPAPDVPGRFGLEPGRFVLAVGSAAPHKNREVITRAARAIGDLGLKVALVGGSRAAVFRGGGRCDSADVVRLGYVDDAALRALYGSAFAFVFPSLYEGFGLPPLEAMALGCPTIVSDIRPLYDTCGDAALRIDPRQPAAVVAALRRLQDPAVRREYAARGAARAAAFTWDAAAQRLLDIVARRPGEGR